MPEVSGPCCKDTISITISMPDGYAEPLSRDPGDNWCTYRGMPVLAGSACVISHPANPKTQDTKC